MTECRPLKSLLLYTTSLHILVNSKIPNEPSHLHYIGLFWDLSIPGANDAPEYPPSWIIFSSSSFLSIQLSLHLPPMSVSVIQTLMMRPSMCGCVRVCGYAVAEGLTTSCPPTVRSSQAPARVLLGKYRKFTHITQWAGACSRTPGGWVQVFISMTDPLINSSGLRTHNHRRRLGSKSL